MLSTDFNSGLRPAKREVMPAASRRQAARRIARIRIACLLLAGSTAACSSTAPTPLVTIVPTSASVDSGGQVSFTISVSNGQAAACTATGGMLAQTGGSLVFTAPVASARFDIRCASGSQSASATVDVSGPITIEYAGGVPDHASEPVSNLPIFFIGQYGPGSSPSFGGQNIPSFSCSRPAWLGGNS